MYGKKCRTCSHSGNHIEEYCRKCFIPYSHMSKPLFPKWEEEREVSDIRSCYTCAHDYKRTGIKCNRSISSCRPPKYTQWSQAISEWQRKQIGLPPALEEHYYSDCNCGKVNCSCLNRDLSWQIDRLYPNTGG